MKRLIRLCFAILLAGWLLTPYAATQSTDPQPVGIIDHFDGKAADYLLKRKGEVEPISLFMPLFPNDMITIKKEQQTIQLVLQGEPQPITVLYKDSPFSVKPTGKVPSKLDHFWEFTKKFFSYWFTITQPKVQQPVHSKGQELSMPLLEKQSIFKPALLKAGKRVLSVGWINGKVPYQVQLATAQGEPLLTVNTENTFVELPEFHFETGKAYRITIKNADAPDWQKIIRGFKVVAQRPEYPDTLKSIRLPEKTRQTLQAAWLAKKHGKQWSYEAYQLVVSVENHAPAQELREALVWGKNR
jgi:hypothetical protein